ncbi:hypothetical protein AWN88_06610 [Agrobacterium tumefaciens]|nr:hypothetical protein AWN88_06610 [Agrobacterium tumefaciens]KAJ36667.1 hypothetical protein BW45_20115 [Agrobacterium tumefaciens]
MLPKPLFLAAGLVCVMVVPVFSQSLEISRLEDKKAGNAAVSSAPSAQSYIIDVSGKTVRLVGPQFLPDSARGLEFPGRGSDHNNTGAETHVLRQ